MDTEADRAYDYDGPCSECDGPEAPNRIIDGGKYRWVCDPCKRGLEERDDPRNPWPDDRGASRSSDECRGCGAVLDAGDRCQCDDEEILAEEFAEEARRADPRGHI